MTYTYPTVIILFALAWTPEEQQETFIFEVRLFDSRQRARTQALGSEKVLRLLDSDAINDVHGEESFSSPELQRTAEYFDTIRRSCITRKMLKDLNIFDKDYLFFQKHMKFNGNGHWILVVVKNPKYIYKDPTVRLKNIDAVFNSRFFSMASFISI